MMRRVLRWLATIIVLCLLAVSVAPLFETQWWAIRLLAFPRLPEAVVVVAAIIVIPFTARGSSLLVLGLEAILLVSLAINAVVLWPYAPFHDRPGARCDASSRLSVMIANVKLGNREAEPLVAMVRQQKPDLFLAMETDGWWNDKLQVLGGTMPYHVQKTTGSYYGMNLFSRLPIASPQIRFLADQDTPAIDTGVTLSTGETIRFLGIHPRPPLPWQSADHRDAQLYAAGLLLDDKNVPTIVAGDLNATPWEIAIQRMRRIAGLVDPRRGNGYVATFNAMSRWEKWPLDQIFYSTGFAAVSLERLSAFGSDHYPFLVHLCRTSDAAGQPPHPLESDDLRAAKAVIERAKSTPAPQP